MLLCSPLVKFENDALASLLIIVAVEKGEFNLLDLPCLQTDVERLLAATAQRMTCISHYLRGLPIPTPILRNVGLLEPDPDNRPQHPCEMASTSTDVSGRKPTTTDDDGSLVVTPNPDNPLSLIFSQKRQQQHQPSNLKTESREVLSDKKHKSKCVSYLNNRYFTLILP